MDLPLVVGVDGSELAMRAVDWATDEAALHGLPLRLVYASLWERYEGPALAEGLGRSSEQIMADTVVRAAAERARRRDSTVRVTTAVVPEDAVGALLAEGMGATALVLGSRGRGGVAGMLLGSVSLTVAARAHCPVIVLRGSHDNRAGGGRYRRIVLGVGDPSHGSEAACFAFTEAAERGVALEAVRAWRRPAHESTDHSLTAGGPARPHEQRAAEILDKALSGAAAGRPGVDVRGRTVEGTARRVLLDASTEADLLVVGVRRQDGRGHIGMQLGRVAHAALHHAACPVAVVPQRG
ncbi:MULTISPECIES: universal stress protein [unclassified Streptomyces]|uniref:universal stress protein n=1 Tax=unclassified Streptomyces TaxID=2593676 RepID=UPI0033A15CF3